VQTAIPRFDRVIEDATDKRILPDDVIYVDPQLDYARDYHHFDILTSEWLVDQIVARLR